MTPTQYQLQRLIKIFKKTLDDKRFSRTERKAVSSVLEENYSLNKSQREFLRGKLFDMAREAAGGYQPIINWLETANKLILECYDQDSSVYFSPGDQCQRVIIRELIRSLSSADICVYTISDDLITAEILKCSERNLSVRIITDNEKVYDSGSDIRALAKAGIKVRVDDSPDYMHHKFAIFDRGTALTGSYNWTRSAAEQNLENILITDDKRVVSAYQAEFDRLWNTLKPFE